MQRTRKLHALREELYEREREVSSLPTELDTTRENLSERDAQVEELAAELGAAWESLSVRDSDIARLNTQLHAMRASTSWRLTIPVRYVEATVKRGVRLAKFTGLALRTPRTSVQILQRLLVAVRQGGMKEVRYKLRLLLESGEGSAQLVISPEERWTEFVPPNAESDPDVFILAVIGWDSRFQRPQHLAAELASSGRRVFYVEMMLEPNGLTGL